jgi:outer membrane murein-binding lipoprotein Lpp
MSGAAGPFYQLKEEAEALETAANVMKLQSQVSMLWAAVDELRQDWHHTRDELQAGQHSMR